MPITLITTKYISTTLTINEVKRLVFHEFRQRLMEAGAKNIQIANQTMSFENLALTFKLGRSPFVYIVRGSVEIFDKGSEIGLRKKLSMQSWPILLYIIPIIYFLYESSYDILQFYAIGFGIVLLSNYLMVAGWANLAIIGDSINLALRKDSGVKISPEQLKWMNDESRCPACGAKVMSDTATCPSCGLALQ